MRLVNLIQEREQEQNPLSIVSESTVLPVAGQEEMNLENADKLLHTAIEEVNRVINAVMQRQLFELDTLNGVAGDIVRSLNADDSLVARIIGMYSQTAVEARHFVRVAVLGLKVSQGLEFTDDERHRLTLAGLVHDVGMLVLPDSIRNKRGRLSTEEFGEIKKHPLYGYQIFRALGEKYDWLARVALEEHEKEDGTGYPRALKGNAIHPFAKIIHLSDIYEALISARPDRRGFSPLEAVKLLIKREKHTFPAELIKALVKQLSAYPVGTLVKLNSNEVGRVVSINPLSPMRPTVEILIDNAGRKLEDKRRVDLFRDTLLHINDTVRALE